MITVVGDAIYDHWMHCRPGDRVDPATGAPVLDVLEIWSGLGGAGAVASMISALGVPIHLVTVGSAWRHDDYTNLSARDGCQVSLIPEDGRIDSLKTRIIQVDAEGTPKHLFRTDAETANTISAASMRHCWNAIQDGRGYSNLLVVADYAKGVMTNSLTKRICGSDHWTVFVDPGRESRIPRYKGADVVKCNTLHAGTWSPRQLCESLGADLAVVTSGKRGCDWWSHSVNPNGGIAPAVEVEEVDPTGCGDQFLAALAVAEYRGLGTIAAVEFANLAAAQQAMRAGIKPVTLGEVKELEDAGHTCCREIVGA